MKRKAISDTERLDWLQRKSDKGYSRSVTDNAALIYTGQEGTVSVRRAIDAAIRASKRKTGGA